jgi:S-adenosylmethionine decarboxylase
MAYHDSLFQLGMDLTRSSTAQKEDHGVTARVAHSARPVHRTHEDVFKHTDTELDGTRFAGRHLSIDVIDATMLDDPRHIERTLRRCAEVAGATLHHVHLHQLSPKGGVAGVAVLSDSHISVHSWPEAGYAAFDVVVRGSVPAERMAEVLRDAFAAGDVVVKTLERGSQPHAMVWQSGKKAPLRVRKAKAA